MLGTILKKNVRFLFSFFFLTATQKGYSRKAKLEDLCDQEKHKHVVLGKCIFWTAWIGWN